MLARRYATIAAVLRKNAVPAQGPVQQRRFASRATHTPTGVLEENQAVRTWVRGERKNLDGFSANFCLELSNRNILKRKILVIAQGNWYAPPLARSFLRPCRASKTIADKLTKHCPTKLTRCISNLRHIMSVGLAATSDCAQESAEEGPIGSRYTK